MGSIKIKFSVKFEDQATETFNKLTQVNGDQVFFRIYVFQGHKEISDG